MNHRLPFLVTNRITSFLAISLIFNCSCLSFAQAQAPPATPAANNADQTSGEAKLSEGQPDVSPELIAKLENALTDTTWTGQFTIDGRQGPPSPESYVIREVSHEGENNWIINAQITYGDREISFPVPVQVRWAGRTPVITLDSVTIPPLGTFDARVLMRRGSYAGTWRHGKKGGHLFGKYAKHEIAEKEIKQQP
jgi:hypothetical protein